MSKDLSAKLTPSSSLPPSPQGSLPSPEGALPPLRPVEVDFPSDTPLPPCTYNVCKAGHKWAPQISVAKCPGCGTPILAVKMVQCPYCNEPVEKMVLRSEHLPHGGTITALCAGSASLNEVILIEIERLHASQEETSYVEREVISKI